MLSRRESVFLAVFLEGLQAVNEPWQLSHCTQAFHSTGEQAGEFRANRIGKGGAPIKTGFPVPVRIRC